MPSQGALRRRQRASTRQRANSCKSAGSGSDHCEGIGLSTDSRKGARACLGATSRSARCEEVGQRAKTREGAGISTRTRSRQREEGGPGTETCHCPYAR
jgi:hypothetical protein